MRAKMRSNGIREQEQHILQALRKHDNLNVYQISKHADYDATRAHYWLKKLIGRKLVVAYVGNGTVTYSLNKDRVKFVNEVMLVKTEGGVVIFTDEDSKVYRMFDKLADLL